MHCAQRRIRARFGRSAGGPPEIRYWHGKCVQSVSDGVVAPEPVPASSTEKAEMKRPCHRNHRNGNLGRSAVVLSAGKTF